MHCRPFFILMRSLCKIWDMYSHWIILTTVALSQLDCFKSVATGKKAGCYIRVGLGFGCPISAGQRNACENMHCRPLFILMRSLCKVWDMYSPWIILTTVALSQLDCFKSVASSHWKKQDVTSTFKEGQHPECEQVHKRGQETGCSMSVEYKTAADLILCLQVSGSRVIIESAAISWR